MDIHVKPPDLGDKPHNVGVDYYSLDVNNSTDSSS